MVLIFVMNQSQAFQNLFGEAFITEVMTAYGNNGVLGIGNMSCPNGVLERLLTNLSMVIRTSIRDPVGAPVVREDPRVRHRRLLDAWAREYQGDNPDGFPDDPEQRLARFRVIVNPKIQGDDENRNPANWEQNIVAYNRNVLSLLGGKRKKTRKGTSKRTRKSRR